MSRELHQGDLAACALGGFLVALFGSHFTFSRLHEVVPPLPPLRTSAPEKPEPPPTLAKAHFECRFVFSEDEQLRLRDECLAEGNFPNVHPTVARCHRFSPYSGFVNWKVSPYEVGAGEYTYEGYYDNGAEGPTPLPSFGRCPL